ncbi:MAG: hypothetical protein Q7S84_04265 [bacterium]|nr:hypothetical protein [bacterium]
MDFARHVVSLAILAGILGTLTFIPARAQEPPQASGLNLILTWEAEVFSPPSYRGRSIPPPGGAAVVMLAATDGRGALTDLSPYRITWSRGGKFVEGGTGLTTRSLTLGASPNRELVRASVYGSTGDLVAEVSMIIPTAKPRIVLSPEPAAENPGFILLRALLLSFSVPDIEDITVSWDVPGGAPGDSFDTFFVPAVPNLSVVGSVTARNPQRVLEYAKQFIKLPYATFE